MIGIRFEQVSKNDWNHLRAVPLTWFNVVLEALVANFLDSENTLGWIIHELRENSEIVFPDLFVFQHFYVEWIPEDMSFYCLEQDHLAGSQHAPPSLIRF